MNMIAVNIFHIIIYFIHIYEWIFRRQKKVIYMWALFVLCKFLDMQFVQNNQIINLSDLECDYINATTCCRRLNVVGV